MTINIRVLYFTKHLFGFKQASGRHSSAIPKLCVVERSNVNLPSEGKVIETNSAAYTMI